MRVLLKCGTAEIAGILTKMPPDAGPKEIRMTLCGCAPGQVKLSTQFDCRCGNVLFKMGYLRGPGIGSITELLSETTPERVG
jgi:hypothetical protein